MDCNEIDIAGYIDGTLDEKEKSIVEQHIEVCLRCWDKVQKSMPDEYIWRYLPINHPSILEEDEGTPTEMPDRSEWVDLPPDLADFTKAAEDPLLEKLKNTFYAIKAKGSQEVSKFVDEFITKAENLLSPPPTPEPVWNAKQDDILPADTDIPMRDIESDFEMELKIDRFVVNLSKTGGVIMISAEKDGEPVSGVRLKVENAGETEQVMVTNEKGEGIKR